MLEDKQGVAILSDDASSKLDRKTIIGKIKPLAKRGAAKRSKHLKKHSWYERAALSMAIKR